MSQFRQIEDGIFIGPQPTGQDLEEARQQGIRTVIDFRLPSETAASNETLVKSHGLAYVNIPVDKTALSANQIGDLEAAMKDKEGPFLLHCATGARAALLLSLSKAKNTAGQPSRHLPRQSGWGSTLRRPPIFQRSCRGPSARPAK